LFIFTPRNLVCCIQTLVALVVNTITYQKKATSDAEQKLFPRVYYPSGFTTTEWAMMATFNTSEEHLGLGQNTSVGWVIQH